MRFYLGTHHPHWLARFDAPMFVSHRRLTGRRTLPAARGPWALDSGGFTELSMHGRWTINPEQYTTAVRRYRDEIGHLAWAAPQDWMCEPWITAKTGLSVTEHQRRTVTNYLTLREIAPDLPFAPVLQGWSMADYEQCAQLYTAEGIDLTTAPVVGLGSVCRRQHTASAEAIITRLHQHGIKNLHGFGFKTLGLHKVGHLLASADSLAWSYAARRKPPMPGCTTHINCANCHRYALAWRERVIAIPERAPAYEQPSLF
ncbi:hypothetical protein QFZ68_004767 [Streptomyces sp. V1I6]|nr:hypothetical protein [Streptomyces sp. V1I6]